nr:MAG TPA: hypothetical protein [Caudoviricetes sp.]
MAHQEINKKGVYFGYKKYKGISTFNQRGY